MSKQRPPATSSPKKESAPFIPPRYQHAAAILVLFLSLIVLFREVVFQSKTFLGSDTIAGRSFETLLHDAEKEGVFPLWNPYIFCGMPGYASLSIHGDRWFDLSAQALSAFSRAFGALINSPDMGWELFYYLLFGVGVYVLVWQKLKNKMAALIAGLAVMHSTGIIVLVVAGHMTKVPVIAFFPWIFIVLERLRDRFEWWQFLLLVLLVHMMILPSHIQIIFYVYLALGVYYVFFLVRSLIKKESPAGLVRSGALLALASVLALGMTADGYFSILEYSGYSIRGAGPITSQSTAEDESLVSGGGLDYEYATNWSLGPGEVFTFAVPSLYGFGRPMYEGPLTQQPTRLPLYFGPQPWTDAPQYMGVIIVILALIGVWKNRSVPFVQFLALLAFISLLISFGKEFPLLYKPMFDYFPFFDKFRVPSMILILVQFLVPVLAAFGIVSLIQDAAKPQSARHWKWIASGAAVGLLISLVAKGVVVSIYEVFFPPQETIQALARSFGSNRQALAAAYEIITTMVAADITVGFLFVGVTFGGLYLFAKRSIRESTLMIVLVVTVFFDLLRVNEKCMDPHPRQTAQEYFRTPDHVNVLLQDTTFFRVMEFQNGQPPYDNTLAYWRIQNAYGYHGAKMRQVQDMFDVVGFHNPLMWGLMNVKYIITDQPDTSALLAPVFAGDKFVLGNRAGLPRAFFVNRYEVAKAIDILTAIRDLKFDPLDVGYFMEDPGVTIEPAGEGAEVHITHHGIQNLEAQVTATGNNLLFFSESWYPEGWKAYLDDEETPIYRLNYMFRGIVVPSGNHTIRMEFEPRGFYAGKHVSLWTNILALGGLASWGGLTLYRRRKAYQ